MHTPPLASTLPYIAADAVARLLPFAELVEALRKAFGATDLVAPQRQHYRLEGLAAGDPVLLAMPAWSAGLGVGAKLVTVYPQNHRMGLPSIHGVYVLMHAATGRPEAVLDAGELTARRTAATSALASRYLSRPHSHTLLMVGTGRLAQVLPLAHASVRPIQRVLVWGRSPQKAESTARYLCSQGLQAEPVDTLAQACAQADIISCATLSSQALVQGEWLKPGTHMDLVGAFTPTMREADDQVFQRASALWCDTLGGVLAEGGDVVQAMASGALMRDCIAGDLSGLCRGSVSVVRSDDDITVFKSVGAALEDLAAARLCLTRLTAQPV